MWELEIIRKTGAWSRSAKKRREATGGNLHTGEWHAWCRNEDHAYA